MVRAFFLAFFLCQPRRNPFYCSGRNLGSQFSSRTHSRVLFRWIESLHCGGVRTQAVLTESLENEAVLGWMCSFFAYLILSFLFTTITVDTKTSSFRVFSSKKIFHRNRKVPRNFRMKGKKGPFKYKYKPTHAVQPFFLTQGTRSPQFVLICFIAFYFKIFMLFVDFSPLALFCFVFLDIIQSTESQTNSLWKDGNVKCWYYFLTLL